MIEKIRKFISIQGRVVCVLFLLLLLVVVLEVCVILGHLRENIIA
jgi:hypothetical protein